MAFGDIAGIKKDGAPPAEEEERRPLRETPLDLSGLLGPRERQDRAGVAPTQRRLSSAEQEIVRRLGPPTIDVVDLEKRPEPSDEPRSFIQSRNDTQLRAIGGLLGALDAIGRRSGTVVGEALLEQLSSPAQKEKFQERLAKQNEVFRIFSGGREPTFDEATTIVNKAINPGRVPGFTGALEVGAALGSLPLESVIGRSLTAASARITRTPRLKAAMDLLTQREAALRGVPQGVSSATEEVIPPVLRAADDVPTRPLSEARPKTVATPIGQLPDLDSVPGIESYIARLEDDIFAARGVSQTDVPGRQTRRLKKEGLGPGVDIDDLVDELAETEDLLARTRAVEAIEARTPQAARARPPRRADRPIPTEEPRQVLPPEPVVPEPPTLRPTSLPGTAPLAADVAAAAPAGPPSIFAQSMQRQLLSRAGAAPLEPGAAAATAAPSGVRAVAPVGNDLASLGGRFANEQTAEVEKVRQLIGASRDIRKQVEAIQSAELKVKAKNVADAFATEDNVFAASRRASAAMEGTLTKGTIEPLLPHMTDKEVTALMRMVQTSPDITPFERFRAMRLINPESPESMLTGHLPTVAEAGLLQKVYGDALANTIADKVGRSGFQRIGDLLTEIANIPRTLFSSYDVSAAGRQGAILVAAEPKISASAFKAQLQAMRSERTAQVFYRNIWQHPDADLLLKSKTFIADINANVGTRLSGREEAYISGIFQRFAGSKFAQNPLMKPLKLAGEGVRASERAYVTYLNKVRADVFYQTVDQWKAAGKEFGDAELRNLGRFINNASGRGNLGFLEGARGVMSAFFFSPGLQASRIGLVRSLFDPTVQGGIRRQIYATVGKSFTLGMTILGMAKLAGAEVELDPRSTNFGKVRIGQTTWDFWGGFQPYARFFAQVATGERKTQAGDIVNIRDDDDQTLLEQAARFGRSKLSPAAGGAVDLITDSTILGDEVISGSNALNTFVPGAIQDMGDVFATEGATGLALGLPAFLGIGVNSYDTTTSLRDGASGNIPVSQDEVDLAPELNLTEGQLGVPFSQRPPYIKDLIDEDPEIVERFKEFEEREKKISTRDLQQIVFTQQEEFQTKANDQLLAQVRSGLQGAALRNAVQQFNRERSAANRAVFDPFNERISKQPTLLRDQLGLEYWTAPLELGPDGELDFDERDRIRADVLQRAKDAKIRASYVKGTGPTTWRGTLSDVPELNTLLTSYQTDMDTLRNYWEVGSDPDFAGAFNRDEWARYIDGSQAVRREISRDSPSVRRAVQKQGEARLALRSNNEDVDKALVRWYEYLGQTVPGRGLYKRLYVEAA